MAGRTTRTTAPRGPEHLESLLVAAGTGDAGSFAALYDALAPRVYGLAHRVVGDPDHAEQVAHDVFVEVWRTAAAFDPEQGSALAWAMAVAHRHAVKKMRSGGARSADETMGDQPRGAVQLPGVLSPAHRRSLELAYFGGHTHVEVARLTRSPLNTSAARLREALAHMRISMTAPAAGPA